MRNMIDYSIDSSKIIGPYKLLDLLFISVLPNFYFKFVYFVVEGKVLLTFFIL